MNIIVWLFCHAQTNLIQIHETCSWKPKMQAFMHQAPSLFQVPNPLTLIDYYLISLSLCLLTLKIGKTFLKGGCKEQIRLTI